MVKKVGILYHPTIDSAPILAKQLMGILHANETPVWLCSAWEEEEVMAKVPGTDLILSIGGDGTILRAARAAAPWSVPIAGINLGRLGFTTELTATEAKDKLPALLEGEGWIDERAMLEVEPPTQESIGDRLHPMPPVHALNDVMVGRGAIARLIYVEARINGELLTTFKADGVVVATATGSTGYSLALGGPILHPQSKEILLNPISPHLTLSHALLLPPTAVVELRVATYHQAMLSIDGQVDSPLHNGDMVRVKLSPHVARFLRLRPPGSFYSSLEQRLKGKG